MVGVYRRFVTTEREKRARIQRRHRELLEIESALWLHGITVAGLDEAGAGPLAGPVVAACVVLDPGKIGPLVGVDDSKQLDASRREHFASLISEHAIAAEIGEASVAEIDRLNIRAASLLAMRRALDLVLVGCPKVGHLLVDARYVPEVDLPQSNIVRGDARSLSIASASILAKVSRDERMVALGSSFPEFGFDRHKGYGTREHLQAIALHGPTPLHRRSFAPVRAAEQGALEFPVVPEV